MAVADGFHVDSIGNLWLGSNRETFDATTRSEAPFYVYANGDMVANSGTFAGTLSSGISISAPVITGGSISGTSGTFTGDISGASGTFTGDLTGADITGGTINIGSGTFQVSNAGAVTASNLTITGGSLNYNSNTFGVTSAGVLTATSGTIGGWTIGSTDLSAGNISIDSGGTISANYSATTGWKIEADGDAFFNKADIRIPSASSSTPTTGFTTLDIGSAKLSEFNDDLWVNSKRVLIYDSDATASASSPSLFLFAAYGQPGWYVDDSQLNRTKLYYSNGVNNVFHTESDNTYLHLDGSGIKVGTATGGNNQYIGKNSSGTFGWHTLPSTGGAHADSDHTSFATTTSLNNHTGNTTNAHGYSPISINGLTMQHGYGIDIIGGGVMSVSAYNSGGYKVEIEHTDSDHSFISSNVSVSAGAVTSNAGYFLRTLSASNNVITYNRSDFGSGLKINSQRPTSNASSSVGISTIEYDEMHSRNGNFTFVYGANLGSSSQEIKTDITDLDLGLNFINDLTPKKYKYVSQVKENDDKYGFGFIAEDIEQVLVDNSETDSKLFVDGRDDYSSYGRCAHELTCTCEDEDCCSYPTETYNADTGEHTSTEGCMFDARCVEPCCTDIAGATIDGVNYIHATEAECEEEFIVSQKYPSLKYDELIAPLVKAVQELSAKNDELESRLAALEG